MLSDLVPAGLIKRVAVVTGAGAGVGRATALAFARAGYDVGLLGRGTERLQDAATEVEALGQRARVVTLDTSDAAAVDAAAEEVEQDLGPIDVWVNNAMVTVFAPVDSTTAEEYRRVTEVTYLGYVHGTLAAMKRMRARRRGAIIQVGSALSYRAIPLQSAYCAAKFAIRGFTDALRVELLHDRMPITLTMVQLPGMNTPQFDWALNRMPHRARPVAPVYQPEVAAEAIVFAARSNRREIFVGMPTWQVILGNKLAPWFLDHYLARTCYDGQFRPELTAADRPDNLFAPLAGHQGAHGSFDSEARNESLALWLTRYRTPMVLGLLTLLGWRCSRSSSRGRSRAAARR